MSPSKLHILTKAVPLRIFLLQEQLSKYLSSSSTQTPIEQDYLWWGCSVSKNTGWNSNNQSTRVCMNSRHRLPLSQSTKFTFCWHVSILRVASCLTYHPLWTAQYSALQTSYRVFYSCPWLAVLYTVARRIRGKLFPAESSQFTIAFYNGPTSSTKLNPTKVNLCLFSSLF